MRWIKISFKCDSVIKPVWELTFPSMDHSQFTSKCQNCTFGGSICNLRRGTSNQGHNGCSVDDRPLGLLVLAERQDGMFAAVPNTFDLNRP